MLDVIFGQASDPGKVRTNNEDAMGSFIPKSRQEARALGWMFVVADGVGGLDMGEVASAKAVQVISEEFAQAQDGTSLLSLLPRLIQHANAAVHDEGLRSDRRGKHMATTVVSCALRHDQAYIAHVGDSRCYHVRDGEAIAITRDHSWVNEQRKLGLISAAEAQTSESRHILTRSLGPELFVTADTNTVALRPRDLLVLCSDGLYGGIRKQRYRPHRLAKQRCRGNCSGTRELFRRSRRLGQRYRPGHFHPRPLKPWRCTGDVLIPCPADKGYGQVGWDYRRPCFPFATRRLGSQDSLVRTLSSSEKRKPSSWARMASERTLRAGRSPLSAVPAMINSSSRRALWR